MERWTIVGIVLAISVLSALSYGMIAGNEDVVVKKDGFMTFYVGEESKQPTACQLALKASIDRARQFKYDEKKEEEERLRNTITRNWFASVDGESYFGYDEDLYGKIDVFEIVG